jgi:hypothetical protein
MRTLRRLPVLLALAALATSAPIAATSAAADAAAAPVNQGYSIPVGQVTDLGALPVLGGLGYDLTRLTGGGAALT